MCPWRDAVRLFPLQTDPRRALHGQEGLEATSFIPRGTVIGPVKGTLMTVAEYHKWKYSSDCIPTGVQPEWWAAVHEAYHWELSNPDIGRYTAHLRPLSSCAPSLPLTCCQILRCPAFPVCQSCPCGPLGSSPLSTPYAGISPSGRMKA